MSAQVPAQQPSALQPPAPAVKVSSEPPLSTRPSTPSTGSESSQGSQPGQVPPGNPLVQEATNSLLNAEEDENILHNTQDNSIDSERITDSPAPTKSTKRANDTQLKEESPPGKRLRSSSKKQEEEKEEEEESSDSDSDDDEKTRSGENSDDDFQLKKGKGGRGSRGGRGRGRA